MLRVIQKKTIIAICTTFLLLQIQFVDAQYDKNGTQWGPYLEWSVTASDVSGNPFDVIADVTFVHTNSAQTTTTRMFYDNNDTWKWRFTGTRAGEWTFNTFSSIPDLNGLSGTVTITVNPNSPTGFVTHQGDKWVYGASGEAFVPQFVMAGGPHVYYNNYGQLDTDITTFIQNHGFNGLHLPVFCRWYDLDHDSCGDVNNADPDIRTFEAIETVISGVNAQGGTTHLWLWGDSERNQNPKQRWGLNSTEDIRIQNYITARLGPIPGWTMGYGFDLFEWVNGSELNVWHSNMQSMGWTHLLGARSNKNELNQISEVMDYSSYEQHRPDYDKYVETILTRPEKPSFSEDRFRIRDGGRAKDYDFDMTRRGLWHSTMAGGVANIWGNLLGDESSNTGDGASLPYPNADQILTYATFWDDRFMVDMERCNALTDGACLYSPSEQLWVFYIEDASSISLDLTGVSSIESAVAVDTKLAYAEIGINLQSGSQVIWQSPYSSDWGLVVRASIGQPEPTVTATVLNPSPTATVLNPSPPATVLNPSPPATVLNPSPTATVLNPEPTSEFTLTPPATSEQEVEGGPGVLPYLRNLTWHSSQGSVPLTEIWYRVIMATEDRTVIMDKWFPHTEVCVQAECKVQLSHDLVELINGTYLWWVMSWQSGVESPWSSETQFTVAVEPPIVLANFQIVPNQGRPTVLWDNDPNVTWIQLYIGNLDTQVLLSWIRKTDEFCDNTTCTYTPDINPTSGEYDIYMQRWGPGGFNGNDINTWVGPESLMLSDSSPGPIIGLSTATAQPWTTRFQWQGSERATWYQLWVGQIDPLVTEHLDWHLGERIGCENLGVCSLELNLASSNLVYEWYVRAWGPGGFTTGGVQGWSSGGLIND